MSQALQTVFHGINRSAAVEQAVEEKVEALRRFDSQLGPCKVTITQEGHQTMGAFTVRIDLVASGQNIIVNRTNMDVMLALNEAFDTVRRSVKEEADKRRHH
ncbi:MAG: HPF/RaiA family ribosome-associated protein [Sutterella sp.]|nr:HPF/RaiA family ribosome-associated protein [Sutterella sp.]